MEGLEPSCSFRHHAPFQGGPIPVMGHFQICQVWESNSLSRGFSPVHSHDWMPWRAFYLYTPIKFLSGLNDCLLTEHDEKIGINLLKITRIRLLDLFLRREKSDNEVQSLLWYSSYNSRARRVDCSAFSCWWIMGCLRFGFAKNLGGRHTPFPLYKYKIDCVWPLYTYLPGTQWWSSGCCANNFDSPVE